MNKKKLLFLFTNILFAQNLWAGINYESVSTSDKLKLSKLSLDYYFLANLGLSYQSFQRSYLDLLETGQRAGLIFKLKEKKSYEFSIEVGAHQVQHEQVGVRDVSVGYFESLFKKTINNSVELRLGVLQDLAYSHLLTVESPRLSLGVIREMAGLNYVPQEDWRFLFQVQNENLSDLNQRTLGSLNGYYGISPHWPWIWVGWGYEQLTSQSIKTEYWSPKLFRATGPRIDTAFPIFSSVSAAIGINYNWAWEEGYEMSQGYYGTLKLIWKPSPGQELSLTAVENKSERGASSWTSSNLFFGAKLSF